MQLLHHLLVRRLELVHLREQVRDEGAGQVDERGAEGVRDDRLRLPVSLAR